MNDCIFCKIIGGEIPCKFLHEDDKSVVFNDLHPKDKTHLLIVPKKHILSIAEMEDGDEKIVGHLVHVAQKLGKEMGLTGYKLQVNVGRDGGQEIFHLHVHLLSKFG